MSSEIYYLIKYNKLDDPTSYEKMYSQYQNTYYLYDIKSNYVLSEIFLNQTSIYQNIEKNNLKKEFYEGFGCWFLLFLLFSIKSKMC